MVKKAGVRALTDGEVCYIRRADREGLRSRKDMAKEFGMNPEVLARICRGETYRNVREVRELGEAEGVRLSERQEQELKDGVQRLVREVEEREKREAAVAAAGFGDAKTGWGETASGPVTPLRDDPDAEAAEALARLRGERV